MKKRIFVYCLFFICCRSGNCQPVNWDTLNGAVDDYVWALFYSPTFNKLFVGGAFNYCDSNFTQRIATYDSTGWMPFPNAGVGIQYNSIIEYQANIYASCGILKKWNGVSWTDISAGGIVDMEVYNNELYVGGSFNSIVGNPISGVAKWDGSNWHDLGFWESGVNSVIHYNGDLYVAGNFYDTSGNVMNIARYDGNQWYEVGGGFHGGIDFATDMEIYNGELYVGGHFTQSSGNVGNKIQKWNGTSWSEVGGGLGYVGQVHKLIVYGGELYAGGSFSEAGGIPVTYIAKWNGQQWCSLGSQLDNAVGAFAEFNGELYVGGGFWTIVGDSIRGIAKWTGGNYTDTCSVVGINEINLSNASMQIYPSPSDGLFNVSLLLEKEAKKLTMSVYNSIGQAVQRQEYKKTSRNFKTTMSIENMPEGIYFIRIDTDEKQYTTKLIKY